jgi:hypothetical protein
LNKELPEGWKKLHNEELHKLCCSSNMTILRRIRRVEYVKRIGGMRNMYIVLVGKPDGRRPLGKPRYRWQDNIKIDIKGIW